ncbi:piggyBac transposable element-derived protein 4-like [Macrosteles quadrilineatus]|uniref:piggyBac transposable element-derived protein 4-like n=1 Tax=Macrosteles quadrilineatus TaxID=74068 RepID=UPI0023E1540E|nr:piggyBac transposable element-derived protein 4-like [Macrosteles quadrilineatus]
MAFRRDDLFLQSDRFAQFVDDILAESGCEVSGDEEDERIISDEDKEICVDESLIKFRGRLSYIQFNPSKRARFGIKIYKLNDSKTGYCYDFKIYTGKETDIHPQEENEENVDDPENGENLEVGENLTENAATPEKSFLLSEKIVLEICADLLDEGRVLYLDNWYSSPKLFLELLNRHTYAVGVVRSDRTNFPKEIKNRQLQLGELTFLHTKKILALKWKDRKDVAMLSTIHTRPEYEEVIPQRERRRPNPQPQLKPNVVINYNNNMNGVDKQDQRLSCFPVMRKCMKGYKKLFFYLFDVTLNNARVIHEIVTKKKSTMSKFRINLAEQILESVNLTNRPVGGRPSVAAESPLRLQARHWGHFIRKILPTSKQRPSRKCRVCSAQGRRSETVYECRKCLVPLHLETCFEVFHTQTNF